MSRGAIVYLSGCIFMVMRKKPRSVVNTHNFYILTSSYNFVETNKFNFSINVFLIPPKRQYLDGIMLWKAVQEQRERDNAAKRQFLLLFD